jgi:hypothetical protein
MFLVIHIACPGIAVYTGILSVISWYNRIRALYCKAAGVLIVNGSRTTLSLFLIPRKKAGLKGKNPDP